MALMPSRQSSSSYLPDVISSRSNNAFLQLGIGWTASVVNLAVQIFRLPFFLNYFDKTADKFFLIIGITAFLAIFEFGISNMAIRHIGRAKTEKDTHEYQDFSYSGRRSGIFSAVSSQ